MASRRFDLPGVFDPFHSGNNPSSSEDVSKSLDAVEEHVAALRLQIFLGKVLQEWPEDVTSMALGWAYETDGPNEAFRVIQCSFEGGEREENQSFEEFIGFSAWTQNQLFMEKLAKLFEDGKRSFSREETRRLVSQTGTPEDWAAHREHALEDKLLATAEPKSSRPRM